MDRIRMVKSKHLASILSTELTYLYTIASLITYKEVQEHEITQLTEWAMRLEDGSDLEHLKIIYHDKLNELNLRAFEPKNYSYTFTTLWNVIHFMALIADDMFINRDKMTYEHITYHLNQIKTIYYNMFSKLDCAMCRDHYLNVKGQLIFNIEKMTICLNKERFGDKCTLVMAEITDKDNEYDNNILMKYNTLHATMVFHNHVNEYKWVQRNMKPPNNAFRMKWSEYKKLLELN
ncbi:P33, Sulfhydryloxidase [Perigonia lusca single nucleopolyhedrovirus]|uniref:p33, Sulfhydryloxidase n=1 Tax=Perigonia lusca single nucleopolyhedrovirus TaxID=1675865 RepID=A0A0M3WN81_9ABAC|nr:P33, Sulfhydryloxidase [Perigonia lusca single nucleopolyhedrovirus]AKN80658.1 P33, Sulfhydryloxidase [Perigonia lusca single nucleopolyhedrovirus]